MFQNPEGGQVSDAIRLTIPPESQPHQPLLSTKQSRPYRAESDPV